MFFYCFWLIGSNPLFTDTTFDHRVRESFSVARSFPNPTRHKYRRAYAINIFTVTDEFVPEILLYVMSKFDPKWTIIIYTT